MNPRIASRTHYQVVEPAYMTLLCKSCVSASKSSYRERVAERLFQEVRNRSNRNKEFNVPAAAYAVDLAKAIGLITQDNVLSAKGQLVDLIGTLKEGEWEEQLVLSLPEKYLYFRLFLEGDGAALQYLARRLRDDGVLPTEGSSWNEIATGMFTEVYSSYLAITGNTADRVALRALRDRVSAKGYGGKGGAHKILIHAQTLFRLGLAGRLQNGRGRVCYITELRPPADSRLTRFCAEIPNVATLERVIEKTQWADVAARVFGARSTIGEADEDMHHILTRVLEYYRRVMHSGAPLCSISTVVEATQIELLASESRLLTFDAAMKQLALLQKARPKDVRFHVDRRGKPAFVKLSDDILTEYCAREIPK